MTIPSSYLYVFVDLIQSDREKYRICSNTWRRTFIINKEIIFNIVPHANLYGREKIHNSSRFYTYSCPSFGNCCINLISLLDFIDHQRT
jgi:hypothetical protein